MFNGYVWLVRGGGGVPRGDEGGTTLLLQDIWSHPRQRVGICSHREPGVMCSSRRLTRFTLGCVYMGFSKIPLNTIID